MRPLRLDLAGFGAFRDQTTVDFTDADFFALVGPTGAGKSTVLDAICFALYGTVPRWRDPRSVVNALSPSAAEARVRLAFETAGARYVATRVVRRDGKGRVKTAGAALQRMPGGFDVRRLDTGLTPDDLGEVLAGTPTEMDAAVPEVVGLPYDQFVTCVVLPQGEFAELLHAKPAIRQQILVNLLGLSVYERVRERAAARATRADAELSATDRLLADLGEVDDATLAGAEARGSELRRLVEAVEAAVPRLAAAQTERDRTAAALGIRDDRIEALSGVTPPAEVAARSGAAAAARAGLAEAGAVVTDAEAEEEKLRGELASAGDPGGLRRRIEEYGERELLAGQRDQLAGAVLAAEAEHTAATSALAQARAGAVLAAEALEAARDGYARAQAADRAAALRAHLVAGEPCPVCAQPVTALPATAPDPALARAEAAGRAARAEAEAAQQLVGERDAAVRDLDRTLATARARACALDSRLGELDARLAGAADLAELHRELAAAEDAGRRLAEASAAVRGARDALRRAQADVGTAQRRLRAAWQDFDTARDALGPLGAGDPDWGGPPAVDRDDLAAGWSALAGWAAARAGQLGAGRAEAAAAVTAADVAVTAARGHLDTLFAGAGLPVPAGETGFAGAAALAAERARAEHERLLARREQASRMREQRAGHERDAQVARALAQHLRANNFEAWLLAEALDALVEGASTILRELTAGQYDLVHEGREFYVVDHHDAGLRRAVRTLSGGETFQASLALALALAEQVAGFPTTAASLESIMLDEGFGTLDATTLEAVATTLENLAARGDRMVGVVTHVPALADRIPVRFEVSKDARSARITRVGL